MTYKSEIEIMRDLEIDNWRNLSRDKILRFVAMMPEMDKEIAIKVIEQFPEFRKFAVDALDVPGAGTLRDPGLQQGEPRQGPPRISRSARDPRE
jgi:hypothetical protein